MAFIKKSKVKGKIYYSLVEKIKVAGKWGIKTIESYGTNKPKVYQPDIIKGFAEVELKKLDDNSVDLIILDPPYGINYDTDFRKNKADNFGSIDLDNETIFKTFPAVVQECYRVLKDASALYCFSRWDVSQRFIDMLSNYFTIKNNLIWVKNNWSMGDLTGSYAGQYENIIFAVKGKHKLNKGRHPDVLKFDRVAGKELKHSHQKPLKLLDFLINKSSVRGDVVLDCYMGSGSTIISATNQGRRSIGIEFSEKYIKISKDRLRKE